MTDPILDALVRDACSVAPVPKSEYRRRLLAWQDAVVAQATKEAQLKLLDTLTNNGYGSIRHEIEHQRKLIAQQDIINGGTENV